MLTGLSPADDVGVHLSRSAAALKFSAGQAAAAAAVNNSEASTNQTTTNATKLTGTTIGNGNGTGTGNATATATAIANPLANGVMRTQNNRLWYH